MRQRKSRNQDEAYKRVIAETGIGEKTWEAYFHEFDTEARHSYWRENKAAILKEWIEKKPGTRPHDWWWFDAPAHRLRIGGDEDWTDEEVAEASTNKSFFGVPNEFYNSRKHIFESEAEFLKRHGLLSKEEEKRLLPEDFEPVTITETEDED